MNVWENTREEEKPEANWNKQAESKNVTIDEERRVFLTHLFSLMDQADILQSMNWKLL